MSTGLFELRDGYGEVVSKHGSKGEAVAKGIDLKKSGKMAGHFVVNSKGTLVWSA